MPMFHAENIHLDKLCPGYCWFNTLTHVCTSNASAPVTNTCPLCTQIHHR